MPRDSSGNYTLVAGNPVIPGTLITDTWCNPTMSDIAAALSDSLSRSGSGGMLTPMLFGDGSRGSPGISWSNEPTSGWYRPSLNTFTYAINNHDIFTIDANGIVLAPGKTAIGIAQFISVADTQPVGMNNGQEWYDSATGGLYMQYQNPDSTFCLILENGAATGNYVPAGNVGQPNGVASLDSTGKVPPGQLPGATVSLAYDDDRLINGSMIIDDRSDGALVALSSTSGNGVYTVDRWQSGCNLSSGTLNVQRINNATGLGNPYALSYSVAVANSSLGSSEVANTVYTFEGLDTADLQWGTAAAQSIAVSFSFVTSIAAAVVAIGFRDYAGTRSYIATITTGAANVPARYVVIIPGDTGGTWPVDNTGSLQVWFAWGAGSSLATFPGSWTAGSYVSAPGATNFMASTSNTWQLTDVKVQAGNSATPMGRHPVSKVRAACQRYCFTVRPKQGSSWVCLAWNDTGYSDVFFMLPLPVTMRTIPQHFQYSGYSNWFITYQGTGHLLGGYLQLYPTTSTQNSATMVGPGVSTSIIPAGALCTLQTGNTSSWFSIDAEIY